MSTDLNPPGFGVTVEDVRAYDWQAIIASVDSHECRDYCEALGKQATALEAAGELKGSGVFRFLAAVASFWPAHDSTEAPYRPAVILSDRRSLIPEDLTAADLATLANILDEIIDPEFRARVADVLWICPPKNYKAAQTAVEGYIEASRVLEAGASWSASLDRLQRARQIGAQIGRLKTFHQKALQAIEEFITRHEAAETSLRCARLMHMLLADGVGDSKRYARLAETLALRMEAIPNWHFAREYWQLRGGWNAKGGMEGEARNVQLKIANTYAKLADGFAAQAEPSYLGASHWQAKAVHALREAKADAEEIRLAHQRLLDFQRRGMGEFQTFGIPLDRSDIQAGLHQAAEGAVALVKGQCFEDAVLRLAYVADPTDPEQFRLRITETGSGGVFTQILGTTTVRSGGQVSDSKPPLASEDPNAREEAIVKEMYSQARRIDWPTRAQVLIEPARQQIIVEHAARRVDLLFLVQDNPFVPPGREGLFLRGLHAGLHGDIVLALHLLLPQVENSIREIFTENGVITSKLESDDTQDERDLGWMLARPEMAKIFGVGMAFDLRGLLVERFGLNVRNDFAHGLLAEGQMITPGTVYAWWLVLRLCCIPIARSKQGSAA